ncbi:MAG: hypothetical protein KDD56_06735, partial [Bdellovibrionales bacterium]|nr:hypothetical protein [Bdellovibrionales bacterium]
MANTHHHSHDSQSFSLVKEGRQTGVASFLDFRKLGHLERISGSINWGEIGFEAKQKEDLKKIIEDGTSPNASSAEKSKALYWIEKLKASSLTKSAVKIEQKESIVGRITSKLSNLFSFLKSPSELEDKLKAEDKNFKSTYKLIPVGEATLFREGDALKWLAVDLKEIEKRLLDPSAKISLWNSPEEWVAKAEEVLKDTLEKLSKDLDFKTLTDTELAEKREEIFSEAIEAFKKVFGSSGSALEDKVVFTGEIGKLSFNPVELDLENGSTLLGTALNKDSEEASLAKLTKILSEENFFVIPLVSAGNGSFAPDNLSVGLLAFDPLAISAQGQEFAQDLLKLCKEFEGGIFPFEECKDFIEKYKNALVEEIAVKEGSASHKKISLLTNDGEVITDLFTLSIDKIDRAKFRNTGSSTDREVLEVLPGETIIRQGLDLFSFSIPKGKSVDDLIGSNDLPADFFEKINEYLLGDDSSALGRYLLQLASSKDYVIRVLHKDRIDFEKRSGIPILKSAVTYSSDRRRMAIKNAGSESVSSAGLAVKKIDTSTYAGKVHLSQFGIRNLNRIARLAGQDPEQVVVYKNLAKLIEPKRLSAEGFKKAKDLISEAQLENQITSLEALELNNLIFMLEHDLASVDTDMPRPFKNDINYSELDEIDIDDIYKVSLYLQANSAKEVNKAYENELNKFEASIQNVLGKVASEDLQKHLEKLKVLAERISKDILGDKVIEINYLLALELKQELLKAVGEELEDLFEKIDKKDEKDFLDIRSSAEELARVIELAADYLIPAQSGSGENLEFDIKPISFVRAKILEELNDINSENELAKEYVQIIKDILLGSEVEDEIAGIPVAGLARLEQAVNFSYEQGELNELDYEAISRNLNRLIPENDKFDLSSFIDSDLKSFQAARQESLNLLNSILNSKDLKSSEEKKKFLEQLKKEISIISEDSKADIFNTVLKLLKSKNAEFDISEEEIRKIIKSIYNLHEYSEYAKDAGRVKLELLVKGKKIVYYYPKDSELLNSQRYKGAKQVFDRILSLTRAGNHTSAHELINSTAEFKGFLQREFEVQTRRFDPDNKLLIFENEVGHIETWEISNPAMENKEVLWQINSFLDWGDYKNARRLLTQFVDRQERFRAQYEDDDEHEKIARIVDYYIPDQIVFSVGDDEYRALAFDPESFSLTEEDRKRIGSIEDLEASVKGEEYNSEKRKFYIQYLKDIVAARKDGLTGTALNAVQSLQKLYVDNIDGKSLIKLSYGLSKEEGEKILENQLKNAWTSKDNHPMLSAGKIKLPATKELEREFSFNPNLLERENPS